MKDKRKALIDLRSERYMIQNKVNRLYNFMMSDDFMKLDSVHAQLLDIQKATMKSYEEVLTARIMLLEKELKESEEGIRNS